MKKRRLLYVKSVSVIAVSVVVVLFVIILVKIQNIYNRNEEEISTEIIETDGDEVLKHTNNNYEDVIDTSDRNNSTGYNNEPWKDTKTQDEQDTRGTTGYGGEGESETGRTEPADELINAKYTYDVLGRVKSIEYEHCMVEYEYDKNGNILNINTTNK